MLAFRFGDALYCRKHFPGNALVIEEHRIIKEHALFGRSCATCAQPFLVEKPAPAQRDAYREQWAKDIEAGKAFPIAGDLFANPGSNLAAQADATQRALAFDNGDAADHGDGK
jgi:hypothetical protein